ncbi:hypothetical protein Tco_0971509 [Tanacetum coccineum]
MTLPITQRPSPKNTELKAPGLTTFKYHHLEKQPPLLAQTEGLDGVSHFMARAYPPMLYTWNFKIIIGVKPTRLPFTSGLLIRVRADNLDVWFLEVKKGRRIFTIGGGKGLREKCGIEPTTAYVGSKCSSWEGKKDWIIRVYARVMIELRADVELKDNIVVALPKITREGHYTCNVRVEYEWKPPRCSSCKVFGHIHEECPKNTGSGEKKTMKKPSQTSRGVLVGPKIRFNPQKEYRHVPKKPNASSSGNKKGVEPTTEVSKSNPFDVFNSVDNDEEFGTNRGTTNLVNNGATSSGSSFMIADNNGEFASNTPIGEKIDKIKRQICEGKLRLFDNDGNPLVSMGIVESDSELEVVFDETANLRISTSGKDGNDKGYVTNSLLEQWRDSYPDNDDYDPYDDDMYENHDLSEHL